ncbi:hypothetical protein COX68_03245 [Candidatus Falkowbacteria bacterium CG_4_10_14_0_2_um_filter_41_15]|uniref:Galactose-1-phosphate uridyl transferase N-terminal domain-containing protein n=4 Tax=Candidatus Falkowiibacteriota TaxID=1752728 RepID=A0A2G9ZNI7_9BACT|nr:MAG: hypothetical protein AUJ35_01105 [Candidatus Falkowbacteria bacterium CG1_02_41_21]PIP34743.1 MAG: hypothetical protein COX21_01265 [Candidatus Falkowbacteria bacterium CG23_combo_of_CG06-09_8_20_14_all_41_10]PIZ10370.1 MAG: hypothetical protein COY54_01640 [Candidatus Falkowbacteria bacterium CG_4_10_14_0_8_um_filter_41_36]PJA09173.1 MAG: hypothetical protein COX68_03245 [Candidatus Falkowbacteria bacterium CG_4_10_14_0_2_um_filter_41_15]
MANKKSEIRKSFIFNKYVIITPGRILRPRDLKEYTDNQPNPDCPFCRQNINQKNVLDKIKIKNNSIICLKNIFPAVALNNPKAYGTQEVIIENANHQKNLADFSLKHIEAILEMYIRRTKAIVKNKKIDYILCFKNQGLKAGASLSHAHSQIFATEIVPEDLREEMILAQRHKIKTGHCAYCDIIKMEMKSSRQIYSDKYVVAFAPYASQFHFEAWIVTKRHIDNIIGLNQNEKRAIAKILKHLALKMQKLNLSFNYFLHNVISDKHQHFYIKIQPRDSIWAGVELGSGLVINSIRPEEAAKYYRK